MTKNNFDFLRFALAFIVVQAHIIDLSREHSLVFLRPFFDAYIAVTCFFVISGFLIARSYANSRTLRSYIVKRASRILPAYFFIILICFLSLSLISVLPLAQYFSDSQLYKYFMANLFFANFIQPCLPGVFSHNPMCTVNGALWTIKVELSFYVILPLLILLANQINRKYYFFAFVYSFALLYKFSMLYYYQQNGNLLFNTLSNQLPAFLTYFICGIALHYYFEQYLRYSRLLCLIALPVFITEHYFGIEVFKPMALSAILFFIAFNFRYLNNFGKHGDLSYGTYIFHFPVIQVFVNYNLFDRYNPWLISVVIILIVLALAFLSWNLLEKKFLSVYRERENKLVLSRSALVQTG